MNDSLRLRKGVLITYILLIVNTISGILLTPFLLRGLGDVEFAIYQLMISISAYITVINLGTGSAMNRFVSMFRANKDKESEEKYVFMNLMISSFLFLISIFIGIFLSSKIDSLFPDILVDSHLIVLAKNLVLFSSVNVGLTFISNSLEGLSNSYGFVDYTQVFSLLRLIIRVLLIMSIMSVGFNSLSIVIVDVLITIIYIVFLCYLCFKKIGVKLQVGKLQKKILTQSVTFSLACMLSGLSGQLNNNIDKVILGVYTNELEITIYSIATTFYIMFTSLASCLNSILLNKITFIIYNSQDMSEINIYNKKIARMQCILIGLIYFGFILLGKEFINLWLGDDYEMVYYYSLILITPNFFVCISGVPETVLDALNKKMFKSITVMIVGFFNVFLSIFLIKISGGIGAPIGTFLALVLGYIVIMNYYYIKKIKLNVGEIYIILIKKIIPLQVICLIISYIIKILLSSIITNLILLFILTGAFFVLLYCVCIYKFILTNLEKFQIVNILGFKRRKL